MAITNRNRLLEVSSWTLGFLLIFFIFRLLTQQGPALNFLNKKGEYLNFSSDQANVLGKDNQTLTWDIDYVEENYYSLDQKDPQLIKFARAQYLTPPSVLPYTYNGKGHHPNPHTKFVTQFFKNKRNGIFLEVGASEGGKSSKSFYFEKMLGWTGLLIECNPKVIPRLKARNRKAWIGSVCLAPTTTPGVLNFSHPINWSYSGTFQKPWNIPVKSSWEILKVETLPLYTLLAALELKEVDYFLFDIEGSELAVLRNFPFDKVIFKVLIVEVYFYNTKEVTELNALLKSNDYHFVKKLDIDNVYVHNSVKHMLTNVK